MSLKTTFLLLLLVATGGLVLWFGPSLAPSLGLSSEPKTPATDSTLTTLERDLTPQAVTRIEVHKGDQVVTIERNGGDWTLPGKWPTRKAEVETLVDLITGLLSRFAPIPLAEAERTG